VVNGKTIKETALTPAVVCPRDAGSDTGWWWCFKCSCLDSKAPTSQKVKHNKSKDRVIFAACGWTMSYDQRQKHGSFSMMEANFVNDAIWIIFYYKDNASSRLNDDRWDSYANFYSGVNYTRGR
jgi:hypothetical protein